MAVVVSSGKCLGDPVTAGSILSLFRNIVFLKTAFSGGLEATSFPMVLDEAGEDMTGEALSVDREAVVSFRNVNFSYQPGRPVIRDFSLTIPSGKTVALVGSTGSGKTTVVNLLMRFYDTDSGEIRINGQNIAEVSRGTLRRAAAIVLQDTVMFSDKIRNNLKYAGETVTQEQRQLLAIARAFVADPKLLILDEATSSVDTRL